MRTTDEPLSYQTKLMVVLSGSKSNPPQDSSGLDSHTKIVSYGSAQAYYDHELGLFSPSDTPCPLCGRTGGLVFYETYPRTTDEFGDSSDGNAGKYYGSRFICSYCRHTHVLVTPMSSPYGFHSYDTMLRALRCGYQDVPVNAVSTRFEISPETFYRWKRQFEADLAVWFHAERRDLDASLCLSFIALLLDPGTDFMLFQNLFILTAGKAFLQSHRNPSVIRQEDAERGGMWSVCAMQETARISRSCSSAAKRLVVQLMQLTADRCCRLLRPFRDIGEALEHGNRMNSRIASLNEVQKQCQGYLNGRTSAPEGGIPRPDALRFTALRAALLNELCVRTFIKNRKASEAPP